MIRMYRLAVIALLTISLAVVAAACSKSDPEHGHKAAPASNQTHVVEAPAAKPAPKAHGGHDPTHGGVVLMDPEFHVELVLDPPSGKHRVFVSDGARAALPASTFDSMTLTIAGERLSMAPALDDKTWEVSGKALPASGVMVSLTYTRGGKQAGRFDDMPIEYVLTGAMPPSTPAPATARHGGLVETTSTGHIELVADRGGSFKVWLLDARMAARQVDGASVTVTVSGKVDQEVVLAASGDHFAGEGSPIAAGHASAVVTVRVGESTEVARFQLHLESGGGHKH